MPRMVLFLMTRRPPRTWHRADGRSVISKDHRLAQVPAVILGQTPVVTHLPPCSCLIPVARRWVGRRFEFECHLHFNCPADGEIPCSVSSPHTCHVSFPVKWSASTETVWLRSDAGTRSGEPGRRRHATGPHCTPGSTSG